MKILRENTILFYLILVIHFKKILLLFLISYDPIDTCYLYINVNTNKMFLQFLRHWIDIHTRLIDIFVFCCTLAGPPRPGMMPAPHMGGPPMMPMMGPPPPGMMPVGPGKLWVE